MKQVIAFSGICAILVAMNMVAWVAAEDISTEERTKADKFRYCPACMMFKSRKGAMTEGMKEIMAEADITDEMLSRRRALMRAPMYADDPAVILGQAERLNLSDEQKSKLMEIQESARKQAVAVLNAQQTKTLGEIPSMPMSMMKYMKQMHEKIRPVVRKRIDEGAEMPMYCPMMWHKEAHFRERVKAKVKKTAITKDKLADAIDTYVQKESASHGGYFVAYDEKIGKELKLTLDKVHRKRLSRVGENLYFACADFKTPEGRIYDLDVFMKGAGKDNLTFSKFSIHKEAGKERYTWYEKDGIWKKKPVKRGREHPEDHPKEHPGKGSREHPTEHPK